ncbi:restriction endonuclease subunit S [Bradyrhizobium sp. LjRoot220]|uniref:restriction endonuclease subunit S n=1 Tax=Bradyrhizobium sp. LjRoot220 TaxID=3342284 RepID=UPI003ED00F74
MSIVLESEQKGQLVSSFEIPSNWTLVQLSSVVQAIAKHDPSEEPDRKITYYDIGSIDGDSGRIVAPKILLGAQAPSRARQLVKKGDILFSTVRPYLKAIAQVTEATAIASTGFCVLRPETIILSDYLFFLVRSNLFLQGILPLQRGVSYPAVRSSDILAQTVPLPPVAEQARIVQKLTELFSELDVAASSLRAANEKLREYRISLLNSAVDGTLSANWRAENSKKNLQSGEYLIAHILGNELTAPTNAKREGKLEGVAAQGTPNSKHLSSLPDGWVWTRVDIVGEVQLGRQRAPRYHSGRNMVPYLRVANVFEGRIDITDIMKMHFSKKEFEQYRLASGDVLLNEGQSLELVGRSAIYKDELPQACFTNTLIRFRPRKGVESSFAHIVFLHYLHSGRFRKIAKITTNIAHLGATRFREVEFPLPGTAEQKQIAILYERSLKEIEKQSTRICASLKLSFDQREAILASAFSGELTEQISEDGVASLEYDALASERKTRIATPRRVKSSSAKTRQTAMSGRIVDVLTEAKSWLSAQEVFDRCGVKDGVKTDEIEKLYLELRGLEKSGQLLVEAVVDKSGRKLHDRLRLKRDRHAAG